MKSGERIGVVGTGRMGANMARHLKDAGYNRRALRRACRRSAQTAADTAASLRVTRARD